jgi:hypothetical protein
MFQESIKNKFEKVKFNNQNTSDVSLALSIWKNAINEAVLDVIGKLRKSILVIKFNLLKLVFYRFLRHRPIGFLVYFPLKLGGAFTTLLFSFCIGLVLNTFP